MKRHLLLFLALAGLAAAAPQQVDFPPQIELRMLFQPENAPLADGDRLFYEFQITSYQPAYSLDKVEVLNERDQVLQTLTGEALQACLLKPKQFPKVEVNTLFMEVPNPNDASAVRHRFTFSSDGQTKTLETPLAEVLHEELPVLGNPFGTKGLWVAVNAPVNDSGHRRAMMTVNGDMHISQRFAVDWVLVDEQHRLFKGDGKRNEDNFCYKTEALAVADGTVVDCQDGLGEAPPSVSERAYPITPRTIGGNWVALQIAPNRYVMYAHLHPGSLRVKKGDKVKKGQVVGLIGNSGNTTAPHLHLHVSNRPDWINAEGMPYVFDRFQRQGRLQGVEEDKPPLFHPQPTGEALRKLPNENDVVTF